MRGTRASSRITRRLVIMCAPSADGGFPATLHSSARIGADVAAPTGAVDKTSDLFTIKPSADKIDREQEDVKPVAAAPAPAAVGASVAAATAPVPATAEATPVTVTQDGTKTTYEYHIGIPIPTGAMNHPAGAAFRKSLGAAIEYPLAAHADAFPKDGMLQKIELVGVNNTDHTIGFTVDGAPRTGGPMPGAGKTFHLTPSGGHQQCDTLAWPYSMSAPVTVYENKAGVDANAKPRGMSKAELDKFHIRIGSGVATCLAAGSPVFDHIASGPNAHLIGADLRDTLNGWRNLAAHGQHDASVMPIMVTDGTPLAEEYKRVEGELNRQHVEHVASLINPANFVLKAKTHVAPSIGVPPAEFVHHAVSSQGHAIGTPIDGYYNQLPATHSIGFCLKMTYEHPPIAN